MNVRTRFSREELDYLRELADFPDESEHIGDCCELGWQRWDRGSIPSFWCEEAGFPNCRDLWIHESPDGTMYWRHGEALLAIPAGLEIYTTNRNGEDERIVFAWLTAIHAHEAVPA